MSAPSALGSLIYRTLLILITLMFSVCRRPSLGPPPTSESLASTPQPPDVSVSAHGAGALQCWFAAQFPRTSWWFPPPWRSVLCASIQPLGTSLSAPFTSPQSSHTTCLLRSSHCCFHSYLGRSSFVSMPMHITLPGARHTPIDEVPTYSSGSQTPPSYFSIVGTPLLSRPRARSAI